MTTFFFTASEASGNETEDSLCASAGSEKEPYSYIMFQRHPEDGDDDDGIYFEFNDQINGAYQCVRACEVARHQIKIELGEPIDWQKQYSSVIVRLEVCEQQYRKFIDILSKIFRREEDSLHLADDAVL
ncbi:MAG: hypothetical protein AAGA29_02870 [Planctomycetota bacterium]